MNSAGDETFPISETGRAANLDIQSVLPPWKLKAESWWFVVSLFGPALEKGKSFPPGHFSERQKREREYAEEDGAFKGGVSVVMLIRYTEAPGGPYDELLMVAGSFKCPPGSPKAVSYRVTRIYVSTMFSVVNGRRNWNIPKELAKFTFTPAPGKSCATEVRVFSVEFFNGETPVFASTPFFAVALKPWRLPAIPCNLKYSPLAIILTQPPLEQSPDASRDGGVGTDPNRWLSMTPSFEGRIKLMSIEGLLGDDDTQTKKRSKRIADGKCFPDIKPYTWGVYWSELNIVFPKGVEILQDT